MIPARNRNNNGRMISVQNHRIPTIFLTPSLKADDLHYQCLLTDPARELELSTEIHLPDISGHRMVGSSQGYLLSVDPIAGNLHATHPITGHRLLLPPSTTFPHVLGLIRHSSSGHVLQYVVNACRNEEVKFETKTAFFEGRRGGQRSRLVSLTRSMFVRTPTLTEFLSSFYARAILSPSLESAFVILDLPVQMLARARLNSGRSRGGPWVPLYSPRTMDLCDLIFHQGLLHAVSSDGSLVVFDDHAHQHHHKGLAPLPGPLVDLDKDKCTRFLVESPNGEDLFLVLRIKREWRTSRHHVRVYRLDKRSYEWNQVESIGDITMFLGLNHSLSLSAPSSDHFPADPSLKPNSIYFADADTGIFNLGDRGIQPFRTPDHFQSPQFRSVWLIPALS